MNNDEQDTDTITISGDTFSIGNLDTIDLSGVSTSITAPGIFSGAYGAQGSYGNVTISSSSGSNGLWAQPAAYTISNKNSGLHVSGDSEFEGDVKVKGRSLISLIEKIEKRLAILTPDPEKLEHFEALKKAYEHYKTLEALCELPKKEEE